MTTRDTQVVRYLNSSTRVCNSSSNKQARPEWRDRSGTCPRASHSVVMSTEYWILWWLWQCLCICGTIVRRSLRSLTETFLLFLFSPLMCFMIQPVFFFPLFFLSWIKQATVNKALLDFFLFFSCLVCGVSCNALPMALYCLLPDLCLISRWNSMSYQNFWIRLSPFSMRLHELGWLAK